MARQINSLINQQETFLKGSSETIRETTLYWFIGFLEGDGSFFISNSVIFFVITQDELVVLYKIKSLLKKGSVQKHGKYFRFIITKNTHLIWLKDLIFSKILFKKVFDRICVCFNLKATYSFLRLNNFLFFKNAWLSGFIDAEGCFYIRLLKREAYSIGYQIRLLFILDQQYVTGDDFLIFERLKLELKGSIIQRKGSNFRFVVEKMSELHKLNKYLKLYPLKSHKKRLQYINWLTCFNIKRKKNISLSDIERIKKIKSWRYSPPIFYRKI